MKKLAKLILSLSLIAVLSMGMAITCLAGEVKSVDTSGENNTIKVSGTTDAGVLACAVLVYDKAGSTLLGMETCAVTSGAYSYTMDKSFDAGNYVVKVADYDGGTFATKEVKVTNASTTPTTGDHMMQTVAISVIVVAAAAAAITVTIVVKKKAANNK